MNEMKWNIMKERQVYFLEIGEGHKKIQGFDNLKKEVQSLETGTIYKIYHIFCIMEQEKR